MRPMRLSPTTILAWLLGLAVLSLSACARPLPGPDPAAAVVEAAASPTPSAPPTITSSALEGTNEKVKTDDFEGVIFSAENAAITGVANQGQTYWTPSQAEVLALENRLGPYLQQTAPRDYPGPLRDLSEYKRQYVGILINGQQVIFVNFFCNAHGLDWSREFVFVTDGGSCYFEVKYNLETGEFSDLSIHGEA